MVMNDLAATTQIAATVVVELTIDYPSFFRKNTQKANPKKTSRKVNDLVVATVEVLIDYPSFLMKTTQKTNP